MPRFCVSCGKEIPLDTKSCEHCGKAGPGPEAEKALTKAPQESPAAELDLPPWVIGMGGGMFLSALAFHLWHTLRTGSRALWTDIGALLTGDPRLRPSGEPTPIADYLDTLSCAYRNWPLVLIAFLLLTSYSVYSVLTAPMPRGERGPSEESPAPGEEPSLPAETATS